MRQRAMGSGVFGGNSLPSKLPIPSPKSPDPSSAMRQLYFDYNATTPIAPSVQQAMLPFLAEQYGNPSSSHALGRAAHEAVEDAREHLAALLGCDPEEIVFTGGGTESNNLALKGRRISPWLDQQAATSSFRRLSIRASSSRQIPRAAWVRHYGCSGDRVRASCSRPLLRTLLRSDTLLVSIMLANNEIGTLQPIKQIADICRARRHPAAHRRGASRGQSPRASR